VIWRHSANGRLGGVCVHCWLLTGWWRGGVLKIARHIWAVGVAGSPVLGRQRGGVLNITVAVWTAGFLWWHSGNKKRTQNVSEYMLVLALCLVYFFYLPVVKLAVTWCACMSGGVVVATRLWSACTVRCRGSVLRCTGWCGSLQRQDWVPYRASGPAVCVSSSAWSVVSLSHAQFLCNWPRSFLPLLNVM